MFYKILSVAIPAVTALGLTACGGNSEPNSAPNTAPMPSTATATVTATVTPKPSPKPATGPRSAVYAYSKAYLSGQGGTAYDLLSTRCKERMTRQAFISLTKMAKAQYGPHAITSYTEKVNDDLARVTYAYTDESLNQTGEPWVEEAGKWKQDDC
jgi:hypothetical protein